jgi:hypothetical protein
MYSGKSISNLFKFCRQCHHGEAICTSYRQIETCAPELSYAYNKLATFRKFGPFYSISEVLNHDLHYKLHCHCVQKKIFTNSAEIWPGDVEYNQENTWLLAK